MPTATAEFLTQDSSALCGDVVCERVAGRSALTRVWATDPLKLLTPAAAGNARHVVLSTYGGGLLGGDRVALRATVKNGARLVLTTQSAGKVYRTEDAASAQSLDAVVHDDAIFAVLPDALCAFTASRFRQRQRYDLSSSGNLVWLDWLSSGRHARGERWAMREISSRTEIAVDGRTLLRETLSLDAETSDIASPMRLGAFDCYAVLAMIGPLLSPMIAQARTRVRVIDLAPPHRLLAADAMLAGGAIFRILGPDVQTVGALVRELLEPLDGLLGQNPWGRKW